MASGCSWWLLVAPCGSFWVLVALVAPGGAWLLLADLCDSWWILVAGGSWWLLVARLVAPGGNWLLLIAAGGSGGSWRLMVVPGMSQWLLLVLAAVRKHFFDFFDSLMFGVLPRDNLLLFLFRNSIFHE